MQIPIDVYLQILRSATPEDNPLSQQPYFTPALGKATAEYLTATANIVDAIRNAPDGPGYDGARDFLENVTHTFPIVNDPRKKSDPLAELRAALGMAPSAEDPQTAVLTDDDLEALFNGPDAKEGD